MKGRVVLMMIRMNYEEKILKMIRSDGEFMKKTTG
jgi:hypothetical protein